MLKGITLAQCSITIEAYIYWAGDIGRRFAEALAAKAKAGVGVKLLLDAVGSSTIGDEILEILEKGGCQLAWYNPMQPSSIGHFNHRTHRKSLIIDGRVAFTGGAGIADHWMGHAEDDQHWRDIQIRLEGRLWCRSRPVSRRTGCRKPAKSSPGSSSTRRRPFEGLARSRRFSAHPRRALDGTDVLLPVHRRGAADDFIADPYFVPDQGAINLLIAASSRGVDVRIMVAGIHNDNWMASQNGVRLYGPLLEGRHRIYEYNHTMLHQRRWSSTACGQRWARPTSTAVRSRTTKRTTCASAMDPREGTRNDFRGRHGGLRGDDAREVAKQAIPGENAAGQSCRCCRNRSEQSKTRD